MTNLITGNLGNIGNLQESTMFDQCKINTCTTGSSIYGGITRTYTSASSSASSICGFKSLSSSKSYAYDVETRLKYDAIFRLPQDVSVSENDRITLTSVSGSTLGTPITYNVANIDNGKGILLVTVNRVKV
jgi:hypothetical protein